MKRVIVSIVVLTVGIGSAVAQDNPPALQELRVYFLDRAVPKRELKDVSAEIRIAPESGSETTLLVPLVEQGRRWEGQTRNVDMIRGLIGTPYFVEVTLWDIQTGTPDRSDASEDSAPKPVETAPLSSQEVLRRAHRGPCFLLKVPRSLLTAPCRITLTIRLEDQSFASENFHFPSSTPGGAVEEAMKALQALRNRVEAGAKFMELKPQAAKFLDDVAQLAPAAFHDDSGSLEQDRQWCLGVGRALEDACDGGNGGLIQNLAAECVPRLKRIQNFLVTKRNHEAESQSP